MKKVFKAALVATMVAISVNANAQLNVGVNVGYVNTDRHLVCDFWAVDISDLIVTPCDGLLVGFFGYMGIYRNFGFSWGLNYIYSFGSKTITDPTGMSIKLKPNDHYLDIPVRLMYSLPLSNDVKLLFFAGPKFAYALAGLTKINVNGLPEGMEIDEEDDLSFKHYGKEDDALFKPLNIYIGGGLGIQYKKYNLKAGYDLGFLNIAKGDKDHAFSTQFYATLGFMF